MRRADDCGHRRETVLTDEAGAPLVDELRNLVPDMPPVGENEILHFGAAGVRCLDDAEETGPVAAAGSEKRVEGVAAEIGMARQRARERIAAVASLQIRRCVRTRRRADVAALRICDHL